MSMQESCTQCNFEEPASDDEPFEYHEQFKTNAFDSSSGSSLNQVEMEVPDHSKFNCKIGVRSFMKLVGSDQPVSPITKSFDIDKVKSIANRKIKARYDSAPKNNWKKKKS